MGLIAKIKSLFIRKAPKVTLGLALGSGARLLGINHLHAHLLAAGREQELSFPALGLLVSALARTQVAALLISAMVMLLPILMLSGMIFPIENLPRFFQWVSAVVPARWYIDAMRRMMIQGASMADVWMDGAVLLAMTGLLLGVSFRKFNDKLE